VRIRSVPITGTAVDQPGNERLVKRVCSNTKKFSDAKATCNAYVVFRAEAAVEAAVQSDGLVFRERHLRIDSATRKDFDAQRSVFLGNLPFDADEEDVRKHFASVLETSAEDGPVVEGVRIVRDALTQRGKGFGYVLLSNRTAVAQALQLHESTFAGRKIRVMTCGKRFKGRRGQPKDEVTTEGDVAHGKKGQVSVKQQMGSRRPKNKGEAPSMPFQGKTAKTSLSGAARRISRKLKKNVGSMGPQKRDRKAKGSGGKHQGKKSRT